jgi:hypothetical protein
MECFDKLLYKVMILTLIVKTGMERPIYLYTTCLNYWVRTFIAKLGMKMFHFLKLLHTFFQLYLCMDWMDISQKD